jgi:hypothetical protein
MDASPSFRQSIPSIIPHQHIDTFLEEPPQVESMRKIDHVLVEHGVGITHDKCVTLLVFCSRVFILNYFTSCSEKHGVKIYLTGGDPSMLTIESLSKNVTHLVWSPKEPFK